MLTIAAGFSTNLGGGHTERIGRPVTTETSRVPALTHAKSANTRGCRGVPLRCILLRSDSCLDGTDDIALRERPPMTP